jgi:drug/metabolite transporter (DMT)-like permease
MPPLALALVIAAALLHALWNIAAKKAGGDHRFVLMAALLVAAIWAPVGLAVGWTVVPRWGATEWAFVVASGLVHLLYFNVLLTGYRKSDLTVVYPVARGTGPLITAAAAVLLLGETLGPLGIAGVVAVAGGVFLIAGGPQLLLARAHDPAQRARVHAGLAWGAATGVLIAGYTVIDGYAVKVLLISPILVDYFSNLTRIPFMLPTLLRDRAGFAAAWRTQWKYALVLAVASPLAYVLVLYAMTMAPLSHVAPAREVSMLFAALLGGRLLGETDRAARLAGAACIAAGVGALALA